MSTTLPITTDVLPSNVPKLDAKGTNWAIFSWRFQVAVEAKELWSAHLDGSAPRPVAATPVSVAMTPGPTAAVAPGTTVQVPTDDEKETLEKWIRKEGLTVLKMTI